MKIGIFKTPEGYEKQVIPACQELGIEYTVIDIFSKDWYQQFENAKCDGYILRPPTENTLWRNIYFQRLLLIRSSIEGVCLPNLNEVLYYESKIMMADFFEVNNIPHPITYTLFKFNEAWNYAKTVPLPAVIKTDGGSGGRGVKIVKRRTELFFRVLKSFFTKNVFRSYHGLNEIILNVKRLFHPWRAFKKSEFRYFPIKDSNQGYLHIQNKIDVKAEWRMIKIGESYFGHQKVADDRGIHSGTKEKKWSLPSENLLNFVEEICNEHNLISMSFDIFETSQGEYLVNEMQTVFGTSTPYQMLNNGIPCRYVNDSSWVLEEGDFCRCGCNVLRLQVLIDQIKSRVERSNYS